MTETLSDFRQPIANEDYRYTDYFYYEKDIIDFIKKLKEEVLRNEKLFPFDYIGKHTLDILDIIDKLVGKALI